MIFDNSGFPQFSAAVRVAPGGDSVAFTLRIECRAGYAVRAANLPDDVEISARLDPLDPLDSFQNIETDPLDLTAFDGETKTVYFEIAADGDADETVAVSQIIVSPA